MSKTIKYGIIGCGMMGQEHLRYIALLEGASVVAIFEPDDEMAELSLSFAPDAVRVGSLDDLLAVDALDCLVIVSPNYCHLDQLEEIGAKRPLPVLVEKPLFTDPADINRVAAFRDAYPAPVWVAMEYRYMPPIAAMREAIDAATGGVKMLSIREHRYPFLEKVGDWNRFNKFSGGTFVEKCCHFFDLMRLLVKSEPVRIMASAGQAVNHIDEEYNGEKPDIIDNGFALVEFENGVRAMLELCMFADGARYQEEISAVGPTGKIEARIPGPSRFWPAHLGTPPVAELVLSPRDGNGPQTQEIHVDPTLLEAGDHNGSTFYQHQGFLELVRGTRAAPEVSLDDGWKAVAMGMAAQESAATGSAVMMSKYLPAPGE